MKNTPSAADVLQVPCGVFMQAEFHHKPVFLSGRYVKFSRELSQTPWFINGERIASGLDTSLEEEIVRKLLPHFKPHSHKFHSSGREDIDVRMLGEGRLFFVELIEPRRFPSAQDLEYTQMEEEVNNDTKLVTINNLALSTQGIFNQAMKDIDSKKKIYRAIVWTARSLTEKDLATINATQDLQVSQKTPIRVLHRRSQLVRTKVIHSMHAEFLTPRFMQLDLCTSSGTYIKEFVHGDRGRTSPSIGSILGCKADILQLDVLNLV